MKTFAFLNLFVLAYSYHPSNAQRLQQTAAQTLVNNYKITTTQSDKLRIETEKIKLANASLQDFKVIIRLVDFSLFFLGMSFWFFRTPWFSCGACHT